MGENLKPKQKPSGPAPREACAAQGSFKGAPFIQGEPVDQDLGLPLLSAAPWWLPQRPPEGCVESKETDVCTAKVSFQWNQPQWQPPPMQMCPHDNSHNADVSPKAHPGVFLVSQLGVSAGPGLPGPLPEASSLRSLEISSSVMMVMSRQKSTFLPCSSSMYTWRQRHTG